MRLAKLEVMLICAQIASLYESDSMLKLINSRLAKRALVCSLAITLVLGCSGTRNKNKDAVTAAKPNVDITRPPVIIGAERDVVVESNPNETISFEEWKRQQTEQTPDSDE